MSENNTKKILIADDEPDVRVYLSTLLEDNGYEVLLAANGKEAVALAIEKKPDLILMDISMPEESGSRAFKEIQDNPATKDIPVVIVTGIDHAYKNFIHSRRTVKPPAGYFEKPIDRDLFISKIHEFLA